MDLSSSPFSPAGIASSPAAARANDGQAASNDFSKTLFGEDGLDFFDFLDVINPLQHIPIISTIYRRITGDELSAASRVAGGALFGGLAGLGSATFSAIVEGNTGKDVGEHIASAFFNEGEAGDTPAMVAQLPANDAPWYRSGQIQYVAAAAPQTLPTQTAANPSVEPVKADIQNSTPQAESTRPWYLSSPRPVKTPVTSTDELALAPLESPPTLDAAAVSSRPSPQDIPPPLPANPAPLATVNAGLSPAPVLDPVTVSTLADAAPAPAPTADAKNQNIDFARAMMSGLNKYQATGQNGAAQGAQVNVSR